ncbi:M20/M25/M40 family metallo-hydrolase [Nibribacter ruber]|uniref:Carboxypeptidase Q n=1 Tax=Nibribacter ruber TaxID=2698458 RepID=A0A6P1NQM5_9BACT|nr:M20/M25/M40 family metallo-hydrolase [Nibribacter ruber]QHL85947.1 M20/M25/M40 family metallo-hydrolase [Nibribacter ruber]
MDSSSRIILSTLALALSLTAHAQSSWPATFQQINAEVQSNSKAYSSLQQASKTIGHRLTGSENGKKAEEYAFNLFKSYGFKEVRYQPFEVESWSRGTLKLQVRINGPHFQDVKAVSLAHSPVKANATGQLVDMGNGLEADYNAQPNAVKGKIALVYLGILPGSPEGARNLHRSEKTALAIKNGAKGIIIINTVAGGTLLTGTASVTGKLIPIPALCVGKEDGLKLKEQLQGGQMVTAQIAMTNHSGKIKARNVIATLKGSELPQEKIVIGGHLDSWDLSTGAIDNGIGSFAVLDMARTFQALNLTPKRTIEFVMFMGEEQGLLGSEAYIEQATKDKSLNNIAYMLNYDMTNDPKGYNASQESMKPLFQSIGAITASIDTTFKNSFSARAGLHSDHQPFMLQGIPTGGSFGGKLPNNGGDCYHADCDSFALVDEQQLKNTVRFSAMLLYGLADADQIQAKKLNDAETKEFLLKNNLKEPLQIAGEWRWAD